MQPQSAFSHKADGSGVFESGQPPIIVGQAAYNSAYGSAFAASGWCNAPNNPSAKCDGFARISEQGGDLFKFDTLNGTQVAVKIEPKALQDETSESSFDEFGRRSGGRRLGFACAGDLDARDTAAASLARATGRGPGH